MTAILAFHDELEIFSAVLTRRTGDAFARRTVALTANHRSRSGDINQSLLIRVALGLGLGRKNPVLSRCLSVDVVL
jgi:hypothetical protein